MNPIKPTAPKKSEPKAPTPQLLPRIEQTTTVFTYGIETRKKKMMRRLGWTTLTLVFIFIFTWVKMPEDKIHQFVMGYVNQQLAPMGMHLSAREAQLSLLGGITYSLKEVTLGVPVALKGATIDSVKISPSFLSLLTGKFAASLSVVFKPGRLDGSIWIRGDRFGINFDSKDFQIGRLGLLPKLLQLESLGFEPDSFDLALSGTTQLTLDMTDLKTLVGQSDLVLTGFAMTPQTIYGLNIPKIQISEVKLSAKSANGQLNLKTLRFGKQGLDPTHADDSDLNGDLYGTLSLGALLDRTTLDLKTEFSISKSLKSSIVLLNALLGPGRRPNGTFGFKITGPLNGMNAQPL